LATLIENAGQVLDRDQIMNRMQRRDWFPTDRTIDVLIARLRKKLGDDRLQPRFINTAHGTGYIFVAEVVYQ
jgi:two-component system OmpR family response regulator